MTSEDAVELITRIAVTGPTPLMYANVHKAFTTLSRSGLTSDQIGTIIGSTVPENGAYNLMQHIFLKPYGYAGDFDLLRKYYDAYDQGYTEHIGMRSVHYHKKHASLWDQYVLSMPVAQAVFNRERYLLRKISWLIQTGQVKSVLDVACGDGRLIRKLRNTFPHVKYMGIDAEGEAIRRASVLDQGTGNVRFEMMDATRRLPSEHFDLVVSAGLFDYLGDNVVIRMFRRLRSYLTPEYMIIGNMVEHSNMAEMSIMGWPLIYRTGVDMISLQQAGRPEKAYIEYEDLNVNLFLNTVES